MFSGNLATATKHETRIPALKGRFYLKYPLWVCSLVILGSGHGIEHGIDSAEVNCSESIEKEISSEGWYTCLLPTLGIGSWSGLNYMHATISALNRS